MFEVFSRILTPTHSNMSKNCIYVIELWPFNQNFKKSIMDFENSKFFQINLTLMYLASSTIFFLKKSFVGVFKFPNLLISGYIFCILVMDCWGRRPILSFCQLVSGIACIGAGLLAGKKVNILCQKTSKSF